MQMIRRRPSIGCVGWSHINEFRGPRDVESAVFLAELPETVGQGSAAGEVHGLRRVAPAVQPNGNAPARHEAAKRFPHRRVGPVNSARAVEFLR